MAKGMYASITKTFHIYDTTTNNLTVTASNITQVFTVTNDNYYFEGTSTVFKSNNGGVANSTAQTTLKALYDMNVEFYYDVSSESNYDKYTITVGSTTVANAISGSHTVQYTGSLQKGQTMVFKYTKDGSQDGGSDVASFYNMKITYTIQTQTGTEDKTVTNKIKKNYAVVGGVTKNIKKIYAVVAGVTRLVFSAELKASRYGTTSSALSQTRDELMGASVGDYAIFAGGAMTYPMTAVDAYNSSLTKNSSISSLSYYRSEGMATNIGDYALFAGGVTYDGYSTRSTLSDIETYNSSLTHGYASSLANARHDGAAGSTDKYAFFYGGGDYDDTYPGESECDVYNTSLTKQNIMYTGVQNYRLGPGSANVGEYVIFAGGSNYGTTRNLVLFVNNSLTYTISQTNLPIAVKGCAYGHTKDYAMVTGGWPQSSNNSSSQVVAWNSSLTLSTPTALSYNKGDHACASLNGIVIVGGGFGGGTYVDSYDNSLTKTVLEATSVAHAYCAAATTGIYALFAGSSSSKTVDVYQVK